MLDFVSFANACGLKIDSVYPSSRITRCPTHSKPRQKNGAYFFDGDRGWCMAWDGDGQIHWFGTERKPWTEQEKSNWIKQRIAAEKSQAQRQERAAIKANELLDQAVVTGHDYLIRKGFPDLVGFVHEKTLIVPMYSITGALVGAQLINWNMDERTFEKKMIPGMRAKGAVYRIGSKSARETFLCEGYATGLSIKTALDTARFNASVLVCFSATNMEFVAPLVGGRRFVCADNDKSGVGEETARRIGLPYCMADEVGHDMNDLHIKAGLFSVVKKLMEVRRL